MTRRSTPKPKARIRRRVRNEHEPDIDLDEEDGWMIGPGKEQPQKAEDDRKH